jgi:hypothetical protein
VTGLVFLAAWVALYFLPAILASKKRNAGAIFVLNLLLGWTIVGWIAALVWALTADELPSAPAQLQQAWFCNRCQAPVYRTQRFCSRCGDAIVWPISV